MSTYDNFYKLRITLTTSGIDNVFHPRETFPVTQMIQKFIHKFKIKNCTGGIEKTNKKGNPVPEHIHFHFEFPQHDDTANPHRNLKNYFQKQIPSLKGNKIWSFPAPALIDDTYRFLRYPLKIHPMLCLFKTDDEDFNYADQSRLSQLEYADVVERNQAYEAKQADKTCLFDKLETYLTEKITERCNPEETPFISEHGKSKMTQELVFHLTMDFYSEQKKPINAQTINGYVITYLLRNGYITNTQYSALKNQNSNLILLHNGLPKKISQENQTSLP
jgi:hypothetical protein